MRGEKRSETDGGGRGGSLGGVGLAGGSSGGGGRGLTQSCQTPESPGQKWNKC